jgi:hypothetical protein
VADGVFCSAAHPDRYRLRMPKVTSATASTAKQRRIAAASEVLWRTIFAEVEPSTALGRVVVCDVAAVRLEEAGLLAEELPQASPVARSRS